MNGSGYTEWHKDHKAQVTKNELYREKQRINNRRDLKHRMNDKECEIQTIQYDTRT